MAINSSFIKLFQQIFHLNKSLFLKALIATVFISIITSLIIQPRYDSRISFYTKKNESGAGFNNFDLSQLMLSGSPVVNNHDFSIMDILNSNDVYEKMLLKNYDSIDMNLIEYWQSIKLLSSKDKIIDYDRKLINNNIKKLKSRITFNESKKSGLISLTVSLESKKLSKEFLNIFFKQISDLLIKVNQEKSSDKVQFFNNITEKYKLELKNKEDDLVLFLTKNKAINDSEILIAERKRLERQVTILSNTYFSLLKELEISKINQSDNLPLLVILDIPKEAHKKSFPPRKLIVIISIFSVFTILNLFFISQSTELRKEFFRLFESS